MGSVQYSGIQIITTDEFLKVAFLLDILHVQKRIVVSDL